MGYKMIQQLLENADLEDVIFQLNNDRRGFKELVGDRDIKPDMIVLVIKLLGKICHSSFKSVMSTSMETVLRSNFIQSMESYISKMPMQVRFLINIYIDINYISIYFFSSLE